jgi:virginiamycin B lyase
LLSTHYIRILLFGYNEGSPSAMRILICILTLVFATSAEPPTTPAPKQGIRTPGIQIPFSSLKPEATFQTPDRPDWIFFSTDVFVPEKDHVDKIDVKNNKIGDPGAGLNKPCGGMVSAFESLWAPACGDGSLVRIDPKTFKVTATITSGTADVRGSLAASADSIWLLTDAKTTLSRIDPDQNAVVGELRVPSGCGSLTFGETALWLACPNGNKVLRINPATNLVEKVIDVSGHPQALAIGGTSVWVLCEKDGTVDRIDPKTNKVAKSIELDVAGAKGALAFGEGSVWVTLAGFPLTRIDPQSETVAQQFFGSGGGGAILTTAGAIWLSNPDPGTLLRIDPKRVLATLAE